MEITALFDDGTTEIDTTVTYGVYLFFTVYP